MGVIFSGAVSEVRGLVGMEPAAVIAAAVIALQLGGSLLILIDGRGAWLGAALLAVFTLVATLLAHRWWIETGIDRVRDFNVFWEHVSIIGGLAIVAVLPRRSADRLWAR